MASKKVGEEEGDGGRWGRGRLGGRGNCSIRNRTDCSRNPQSEHDLKSALCSKETGYLYAGIPFATCGIRGAQPLPAKS